MDILKSNQNRTMTEHRTNDLLTKYSGRTLSKRTENTIRSCGIRNGSIFERTFKNGIAAYREQQKYAGSAIFQSEQDQKNRSNQMILYSNSVSKEEFGKLCEDGFFPLHMDADEFVTVLDRIKVSIAKSGTIIEGFNDHLSKDLVKDATGSESLSVMIHRALKEYGLTRTKEQTEALKGVVTMGTQLQDLTDASKKFLVENNLNPTIKNLYMAQFSGSETGQQPYGYYEQESTGYLAKKADMTGDSDLRKEMEQYLSMQGFATDEETVREAMWLSTEGIAVTEASLSLSKELNELKLPANEDEWVQFAVKAGRDGISPFEASLFRVVEKSIEEQAVEIRDRFFRITEDAFSELPDLEHVTLKTLEQAMDAYLMKNTDNNKDLSGVNSKSPKQEDANAMDEKNGNEARMFAENEQLLRQKSLLAQIRLSMTADANLHLLRKGISIDTTELSALVEHYEEAEKELSKSLFPTDSEDLAIQNYDRLLDTQKIVSEFPSLPVSIVAMSLQEGKEVTFHAYYEEGQARLLQLQEANRSYETFMTVARSDLGDSMKKAFRNLDEILEEVGIKKTDRNRRAARILSYNHLEITKEAVETVSKADDQLQYVIKNLNPSTTLRLIREGEFLMDMTMDELTEKINETKETPEAKEEQFAQFLYELDQKKGITKEERQAYLEIYRTFKVLAKTDEAALGAMLSDQAEYTLRNLKLLSNIAHKQIDYTIGEDELTKQQFLRDVANISHTLRMKNFEHLVDNKEEGVITVEDALSILLEDDTLEDDTLEDAQGRMEPSQTQTYENAIREELQQAFQCQESIWDEIQNNGLPVTAENLIAAQELKEKRGNLVWKLSEQLSETFFKEFSKAREVFDSKDSVDTFYDSMWKKASEELQKTMEEADGYLDFKAMSLLNKQIGICQALKKRNEYEVPVMIGSTLNSIHVTLKESENDQGMVTVSTELADHTRLGGYFTNEKDGIRGILAANSKDGCAYLNEICETFQQNLSEHGFQVQSLEVIYSENLELDRIDRQGVSEKTPSDQYFQMAKLFLGSIS